MNIRSEKVPSPGTKPLDVTLIRTPNLDEQVYVLPTLDSASKASRTPIGSSFDPFGSFLLYPLDNTSEVVAEDKKLHALYDAPLPQEKENKDLEQTGIQPPSVVEERTALVQQQESQPEPHLPKQTAKRGAVPEEQSSSTPLGASQAPSETPIPSKKLKKLV